MIVDLKEDSVFPERSVYNCRDSSGKSIITSIDELRKIRNCSLHYGAETYVCLDSESYSDKEMKRITELVRFTCMEIGIDGIVTGNPGLILAIREENIFTDVVVSPEELVLNRQTVMFWNELGVMKMFLPSYLTTGETVALVSSMKKCKFYITVFRGNVPSGDFSVLSEAPPASRPDRRFVGNIDAIFCALCTIPRFFRAGVSGVIVHLKGEPCHAKIGLIIVVKRLVDMVQQHMSDEEVKRTAREEMECEGLREGEYLCLAEPPAVKQTGKPDSH